MLMLPVAGPGGGLISLTLAIIAACLAVRLLSSIPYPDPGSEPFLIGHTLDPTSTTDTQYRTWGSQEWVNWLNRREPLHTEARSRLKNPSSPPSKPLNEKPLNTVVIATPGEIFNAFTGRLQRYGNGMVWSNRKFPTYMFDYSKSQKRYLVFRCPDTFIAVKLVKQKPVHLQTFSDVIITTGNANFAYKKRCTQLQ